MLKDKKILAGGAVLFLAAFWFYIKPNYMDAKPAPVITHAQIDASPHPTVMLGKAVGPEAAKSNAPEGLVLNLKATSGTPSYVKAVIALEFERPKKPWLGVTGDALTAKNVLYTHELEHEMPKILDAVATVFSSKTADQIATVEGRELLKTDLIEAINEYLAAEKVESIYFETLITQ
ncbi:MAG: flagellar basal body-associated FliL family protein [bacterium]